MPKQRIPGTVRTDIADDSKGDPSRAYPSQPDIYVPDEKIADENHAAGEHEPHPRRDAKDDDEPERG